MIRPCVAVCCFPSPSLLQSAAAAAMSHSVWNMTSSVSSSSALVVQGSWLEDRPCCCTELEGEKREASTEVVCPSPLSCRLAAPFLFHLILLDFVFCSACVFKAMSVFFYEFKLVKKYNCYIYLSTLCQRERICIFHNYLYMYHRTGKLKNEGNLEIGLGDMAYEWYCNIFKLCCIRLYFSIF